MINVGWNVYYGQARSKQRTVPHPICPAIPKDGGVDRIWLDLLNPISPRGNQTSRVGCPTGSALTARRLLTPKGDRDRRAPSPLVVVTPRGTAIRRGTNRPARSLAAGFGRPKMTATKNQIPPRPDASPDGETPFRGGQTPELGWLRSMKSGTSAPREMQQMNWGSSTSGVFSPRESVSGARLVRASPGPMLSWASASSGISPP
jgi:hypothetical protein